MTDAEKNRCPRCSRLVGMATYSCTVPGCLQTRFCCPACICDHMGDHVRDKDNQLAETRAQLAAGVDLLQQVFSADWSRYASDVSAVLVPEALRGAIVDFYLSPALSPLVERVRALEAVARAAEALLVRIAHVEDHPAYLAVWTLAAAHGCPYSGPTYEQAKLALLAALKEPQHG